MFPLLFFEKGGLVVSVGRVVAVLNTTKRGTPAVPATQGNRDGAPEVLNRDGAPEGER